MQGLQESKSVSQNELHLTYKLTPSNLLCIKLVFLPGTKQLAAVDISGIDANFGELIDSYLQTNDVHGLISSVLAKARRC
jgi:hypothetical protein